MTISILESNESEMVVDQDGVRKFIPRDITNTIYSQLIGTNYQDVSRNDSQYEAFPFTQVIGGYLVAIYSDGDAHAQSDRQIMIRKPVASIADQTVAWESVTFFENAGAVFDFTLLTDIMTNGESFTFKVWVVTKTAGVVSQNTLSSFVESGNADPDLDGTYAIWSKPRQFAAFPGVYFRVAYEVDAVNGWNSAVWQSTDQITWTYKGVIAKGHGSGLEYNEADIVETTSGNYLAVIREDSGVGRPLYTSTSADLVTWTAPALSTDFNGTQPNLIKLASGTILLSVGDRVGSTGIDAAGFATTYNDKTGVSYYVSTDNGATWSDGTLMDLSWSTDCGQPFSEEVSADVIASVYYNSLGPTNDGTTEPGIRVKVFSESNIV